VGGWPARPEPRGHLTRPPTPRRSRGKDAAQAVAGNPAWAGRKSRPAFGARSGDGDVAIHLLRPGARTGDSALRGGGQFFEPAAGHAANLVNAPVDEEELLLADPALVMHQAPEDAELFELQVQFAQERRLFGALGVEGAHGQEVALTTDPLNPDTDGDGVPDGQDPNPLVPNRAPTLAVGPTIEIVQDALTNVPVVARDLDGNLAGVQLRLNPAGGDNHATFTALAWRNGAATQPAQVIGGFDTVRGGRVSLAEGDLVASLRVAITNAFPLAVLTGAPTLSADYLRTADFVMLASPFDYGVAIAPLTAAEQSALRSFVEGGGSADVVVYDDTFATNAAQANNSLLVPFGVHVTGAIADSNAVATVDSQYLQAGHPLVTGPFGIIASFSSRLPPARPAGFGCLPRLRPGMLPWFVLGRRDCPSSLRPAPISASGGSSPPAWSRPRPAITPAASICLRHTPPASACGVGK